MDMDQTQMHELASLLNRIDRDRGDGHGVAIEGGFITLIRNNKDLYRINFSHETQSWIVENLNDQ